LAGVSRQQYASDIKLIRVMCSGRVDLAFVLRAFSNGNDGVFIGGCHLNECHYITNGNYHALSMVLLCKKLFEHIGLSPERLRIEWLSAGEGIRFAEVMNDFSKKLRELGPLAEGEGNGKEGMKLKLKALSELVPYIRLVERERLRVRFDSQEAYEKFYNSDEVNELIRELILDKLAVSQILSLLREKPLSTGEISEILSLDPSEVTKYLGSSARQGLINFDLTQKRFILA
jgi:F420-non-reducing hydrogenase iron-sulfur subunit